MAYVINAQHRGAQMSYLGKVPLLNQAVNRGIYYWPKTTTVRTLQGLRRMGQSSSISTPLLVAGLGILGLAGLMLMRKGSSRVKRATKLASQRASIDRQLKALGA